MKKLISILAIFSMLFCSAVSSFSFAENNDKSKSDVVQVNSSNNQKEETIGKLKIALTAACMACLTSVVGFSSYLYGYNKGKNETSIYNMVKSAYNWVTGPAWEGTKYGVETAYNWVTGPAWDGTKYGAETAWNGTKYGLGKACNGTKYGAETAWNGTKNKVGTAKDWTIAKWCNYVGWGCGNRNDSNEQINNQTGI